MSLPHTCVCRTCGHEMATFTSAPNEMPFKCTSCGKKFGFSHPRLGIHEIGPDVCMCGRSPIDAKVDV